MHWQELNFTCSPTLQPTRTFTLTHFLVTEMNWSTPTVLHRLLHTIFKALGLLPAFRDLHTEAHPPCTKDPESHYVY